MKKLRGSFVGPVSAAPPGTEAISSNTVDKSAFKRSFAIRQWAFLPFKKYFSCRDFLVGKYVSRWRHLIT
jgi:hypothetical protein